MTLPSIFLSARKPEACRSPDRQLRKGEGARRLAEAFLFLIALVLQTSTRLPAGATPPAPLRRTTIDRSGDLFEAMLETATSERTTTLRTADAGASDPETRASDPDVLSLEQIEGFCRDAIRRYEPRSTAAAKWTCRLVRVSTRIARASADFSEAKVSQVTAPIDQLLASYPDHSARLFLVAAKLRAIRAAAAHDAMVFLGSPHRQDLVDRGLGRLTQLVAKNEALIRQVVSRQSDIAGDAHRPENAARIADAKRLEQTLRINLVQAMLIQTEFLAPGSPDAIAAASQVIAAARAAHDALPGNSAARVEIDLLRIDALIRSGQPEAAERRLGLLASAARQSGLANSFDALQIRAAIRADRVAHATRLVHQFYGDAPENAERSLEMDLARLHALLAAARMKDASVSLKEIADWIDAMGRRGGRYARRRGEAVVLAAGIEIDRASALPPELIASQGEAMLRRGRSAEAFEKLATAARAEAKPGKAIERAGRAAAVAMGENRRPLAAEILREVATRHPTHPRSAAVMLQSISILAPAAETPDHVAELAISLRTLSRQWPSTQEAFLARAWLARILAAQERAADAAEAVLSFSAKNVAAAQSSPQLSMEAYRRAAQFWTDAFTGTPVDSESRRSLVARFESSFRDHFGHPGAKSAWNRVAAFDLTVAELREILAREKPDSRRSADFYGALVKYRLDGDRTPELLQVDAAEMDRAIEQLMRDGRRDPSRRRPSVRLIHRWQAQSRLPPTESSGSNASEPPNASGDSIGHAERLFWMGEASAGLKMIRRLVTPDADSKTPNVSAETLRQCAGVLSRSREPVAVQAAVGLWDRLAAGIRRGSLPWHRAKLSAIAALSELGETELARKRAAFILLTVRPIDPELSNEYQQAGK